MVRDCWQRDAAHTMPLLKKLAEDVFVDVFSALSAHIGQLKGS